ncbi:MAG: carboxypeptidase regulatory-like domain-containing protein, partial [Acidobacteria bacterium]|nr:carboxypeptidase regulatory-like domain-containing protein [Acidobacteriota bacterium]
MKNHAKYLVCVLSCLGLFLVSTPAQAAEALSLAGTIVDQSNSPIPGATINLYATPGWISRAQTGAHGGFQFDHLVPGIYILECYQEGFQTLSRRLVLRDRSEALHLTLEVAGLNQHVVVIAAALPELPSEISKSVSFISNEELANRDVVTLTEGLRQIPSLQIQQLGGPGTVAGYRFRGLRPEDTAILLDGFRFLDPSDIKNSARPLLSDLLLTDADHVEVL